MKEDHQRSGLHRNLPAAPPPFSVVPPHRQPPEAKEEEKKPSQPPNLPSAEGKQTEKGEGRGTWQI